MLADDFVESFRRQDSTEQIISGFGRGFLRCLAYADDFANSLQARSVVLLLQPFDLGGNRSGARLDTSVIGFDLGLSNLVPPHRRGRRGG